MKSHHCVFSAISVNLVEVEDARLDVVFDGLSKLSCGLDTADLLGKGPVNLTSPTHALLPFSATLFLKSLSPFLKIVSQCRQLLPMLK